MQYKNLKKKHDITSRWSRDSVEYSSISTELCEVKRKNILEKMRSQVVEYSYPKEISKKYSGKLHWNISYRLLNSCFWKVKCKCIAAILLVLLNSNICCFISYIFLFCSFVWLEWNNCWVQTRFKEF